MKRLVVCALLVGCGGDDGTPVPLDNLGMELSTVSCAKMFDCCTDAEIMKQFMGITYEDQPITTEEQCVGFSNAIFTGLAVTQYKESLAKGRIEYDEAAAGGCIAAIEDVSCSEYGGREFLDDSRCRPFIIPKVANDGACTEDYECTSDNCAGADGDTEGACKPIPTAGQACDDDCADGLYCGFDTSNGMRVCQALKANGAMCSLDRECESDTCDDASHLCATPAATCDGR
jgi:hypothetical protein